MNRKILFLALLAVVLFTSCTSTKPKSLALEVVNTTDRPLFQLSVSENDLLQAGYRQGDWVLIELGGMLIKALVSDRAMHQTTTLVAGPTSSYLYTPTAIENGSSGILFPYTRQEEKAQSSVSFSGNFVFSL